MTFVTLSYLLGTLLIYILKEHNIVDGIDQNKKGLTIKHNYIIRYSYSKIFTENEK